MHTMDNTPRIITILGLVLEGVSLIGIALVVLFLNLSGTTALFTPESMDISVSEFNEFMKVFNIIINVFYGVFIVYFVMFIINLYLFIPLINGKCTTDKARKIYLYQAIWGGISLLGNTLVGILYLVSGVQGRNGYREEKNIRDGI